MESELPPDPAITPERVRQPTASECATLPTKPTPATPVITDGPAYRDRSTGLMFFGIVQIILGLLAALMVPLMGLGMLLSRPSSGVARPAQFLSSIVVYVFFSIAMVTLGLGSIQAKRWARALTVIVSWYWLINGILITILMTAALPMGVRSALAHVQQNAPGAPPADFSTGLMAVVLTVMIVFMAFLLIAAPTAFVVFYSRRDVEQTCRNRDSIERWTDRTPLPVLGASVVLFISSLYMLVTGSTTPLFPLFGQYLTGIGGALCFLGLAVVDFYIAIAMFRLQVVGWWIAVLTLFLRIASMAFTYARADLMTAFSKLGFSSQQLKMIAENPMIRGRVFLWWSLMSLLIFLGYLVWLRRYFKQPAATTAADPVSNLG